MSKCIKYVLKYPHTIKLQKQERKLGRDLKKKKKLIKIA